MLNYLSTQPSMKKDIRNLRTYSKLTQKELAVKADVPISKLSKCERGLLIPNRHFFDSIAKILSVSSRELQQAHSELFKNPLSGEGYVTSISNTSFVLERRKKIDEKKIPIVDVFCGIGGFSHGFEQTGKFQVISGIDLLPDRAKTFSINHPASKTFCANIFDFSIKEFKNDVKKPEIVIGGPPCQGFSSIRPFRSVNENDSRNNLFEYFALVVDSVKPEWFVLENVVGLLTHQNGKTMKRLRSIFQEMGYTISWSVLNAAHYGLPQRRERLIIVGNDDGKDFKFPKPTHYFNGRSMAKRQIRGFSKLEKNSLKPATTVMDAIGDMPELKSGEVCSQYPENCKLTEYSKKMRGKQKHITLHQATMHSNKMLEIIKHAGPNINSIPKKLITSGFSTSYSRLEPNEPSVTITVNFCFPGSNKCIHPYQNRALTPREAARLQGFEDSYLFKGTRNQVVKQIGNAVPPILGNVIARSISKLM